MRLLGLILWGYVRLSAEKLKIEAFVIHQEKKLKMQPHMHTMEEKDQHHLSIHLIMLLIVNIKNGKERKIGISNNNVIKSQNHIEILNILNRIFMKDRNQI